MRTASDDGRAQAQIKVSVQAEDFSLAEEMAALQQACPAAGAMASFVGLVRGQVTAVDPQASHAETPSVVETALTHLLIEHYPAMTEKALHAIVQTAHTRWPLMAVTVIHRIGLLPAQAQIVLVLTASSHRQAAFEACAYIMDYLKTDAPFWKKEIGAFGAQWVEARASDEAAKQQWKPAS